MMEKQIYPSNFPFYYKIEVQRGMLFMDMNADEILTFFGVSLQIK